MRGENKVMQYYIKNDKGEFEEADVSEMFRERKARWERSESRRIREETEESIRQELTEKLTADITGQVSADYDKRIAAIESEKAALATEKQELEISFNQKKVASEYGFKPEMEKVLGRGTEEEMRAVADTIKSNYSSDSTTNLEKETRSTDGTSEGNGLVITI